MYPEEFARPVKQQVLAQAKGYAYVCKPLLLLGVCNAFPMEELLLGSILLAFMHIVKCGRAGGVTSISVARGGAGGAAAPPNNAFSDFCRYIWKFVGTFGNLSVHVSRQACHLYRQSI